MAEMNREQALKELRAYLSDAAYERVIDALSSCGEPIAQGWLDIENDHKETEDGKGLHLRFYLRNDSPLRHITLKRVAVFEALPTEEGT